jgi:predicted membrane metal-binding protein
MHQTGFFHHVGTFLLLAATVFLIVTDISAPVVHNIGMLKVQLGGSNSGKELSFGTFGWCLIQNG